MLTARRRSLLPLPWSPPCGRVADCRLVRVTWASQRMPQEFRRDHRMLIESLLDTDLYKFTMMQVVLHHFPEAQVEYRFKCRTPGVDLTPYIDEIGREVSALCRLRFSQREL